MPDRNFKLAALLMVREQRERTEELALARLSARKADLQASLHRILFAIEELAKLRVPNNVAMPLAADYRDLECRRQSLEHARNEILSRLRALEEECRKQQAHYIHARSDREAISDLHEAHKQARRRYLDTWEQKTLEDLMLARRKRSSTFD